MTATQNVSQPTTSSNTPKLTPHGVLTLFGYGIKVRVDRGHLLVEDGIGADRYQLRLPRVGHGLRRLVIIGSDLTTSRYCRSVPVHCFDSRAARSSLITFSKVLRSAIGQTPGYLRLWKRLPEGAQGEGGLCYFLSASHNGV